MSLRRLLGAAGVVLAVSAPAASAAGDLTLRTVDTSRLPNVRLVVALATAPSGTPVFHVRENTADVGALTVGSAATSTSYALVVDTSQSMKGRAMRAAADGARTFLTTLKPADRVGIYGFGSEVRELASFTEDPTKLASAVNGLAIDERQGTALNDGIVAAAHGLASEDAGRRRVLIVLTDGDDTTSGATAAVAAKAAADAQAAVYAIGIASDDFQPGELKALAGATGGTYAEGNPREIEQVYQTVADDLRKTFVLTYGSSASGRVALEVDAGEGGIATTNYVGGAPARIKAGEGVIPASITHASWSPAALAAGALLLMLLGGFLIFRPRPRKTLAQHLAPYTDSRSRALKAAQAADGGSSFGALRFFAVITERVLGRLDLWKSMSSAIERADLPLKTAELFYMMLGSGLLGALLFGALLGLPGLFALAMMVVCGFIPFIYVRLKARKRSKLFDSQLADILISMASSLKAGHSFNQAMESTIKEGADPAAKEFSRVANEIRLGRASEEALEAMAKRLGSKNFEYVVTAVNIQRQVGGSMAELLDGVGETVRMRQQFLRKVKALTSMGRMSAYTLVGLPIFLALAIYAMNQEYMAPLLETSTGHVLIIVAVISMSVGALCLKKIVSFRV